MIMASQEEIEAILWGDDDASDSDGEPEDSGTLVFEEEGQGKIVIQCDDLDHIEPDALDVVTGDVYEMHEEFTDEEEDPTTLPSTSHATTLTTGPSHETVCSRRRGGGSCTYGR